jgi:hypothetical protein
VEYGKARFTEARLFRSGPDSTPSRRRRKLPSALGSAMVKYINIVGWSVMGAALLVLAISSGWIF